MSLPSTLYKFSDATGARGILTTQCLRTKSPLDFNDPFEAFPAYDEERKNYMIATRREFDDRIGQPGMGDLTEEGNDEATPVENWVGLNAQHHDQFFERVHAVYRVLCLSKAPTATLPWSLYASAHRGIAIGFDLRSTDFPKGQITEVIFGYHCPVSEIESTAELLKGGYPSAKLGYVDLHPYEYKVRVHYGNLKQILATQKMRLEHSFRVRIRK